MRYSFNFFILFLVVIILSSCREKLLDDYKINFSEDEKLVINSFMYAGENSIVKLSKTIPTLADSGTSSTIPSGGTVKLMQNGLMLEQLTEIVPGYFIGSQVQFQVGQAYYFEVTVPGFPIATSMQETIPLFPILSLDAIEYALDSSSRTINFSFQDFPADNNIYFVAISWHYNGNWSQSMAPQEDINQFPYLSGLNTLSYPCKNIFLGSNAYVLTDLCGQEYTFNMQFGVGKQVWEFDSTFHAHYYDIDSVKIILQHVSVPYYNYKKSLSDHYIAQDDPFSDVVPILFNINNGYGIAAGIAKDSIIIALH